MQLINLDFTGYYGEQSIGALPNSSGIYVVYDGIHNATSNTVSLQKLLYIGESADIRERISTHEKWPLWRRASNHTLWLSYALIVEPGRKRGEAALIYEHKPPINDEFKYSFPFEATRMRLTGSTALLKTDFVVYPTANNNSFLRY